MKRQRFSLLLVALLTGSVGINSGAASLPQDLEKAWTKLSGSTGDEAVEGMVLDSMGDLWITGVTDGDFDGSNAGGDDVFVMKYETNGPKLFTKQFGSDGTDIVRDIAAGPNGSVYVAGETTGDIDGTPSTTAYQDVFVAKLGSNGNIIWIKDYGNFWHDKGRTVAVDMDGNAYVAGETDDSFDGYTNAGNTDVFCPNSAVMVGCCGRSSSEVTDMICRSMLLRIHLEMCMSLVPRRVIFMARTKGIRMCS